MCVKRSWLFLEQGLAPRVFMPSVARAGPGDGRSRGSGAQDAWRRQRAAPGRAGDRAESGANRG